MADEPLQPSDTICFMIHYLKKQLFATPTQSAMTFLLLSVFGFAAYHLSHWMLWDATWTGTAEVCHTNSGACWAFIADKFRFILFGTYPFAEHWRPAFGLIGFFVLIVLALRQKNWNVRSLAKFLGGWLALFFLIRGGVLGLAYVDSEHISGLPLTIILAMHGILFSYPLAIALSLGRRSTWPVLRTLCTAYIELIRGVPLISLLFMSSVMIPFFFPEGFFLNKILRAQLAIILFVSAYLAEVIRGGLAALPKGQWEAAQALGLRTWQMYRLVILPQALRLVIPPTVNIFVSVLKDTTLVVVISMYDLLGTGKAALTDPLWLGFSRELYVFLALVYFVMCYALTRYSKSLESRYD